MKLYELAWGLYPRRIAIYLAEKGIAGVQRIEFDATAGWPAPEMAQLSAMGTVPILDTGDGTVIRSSIAILEYLEQRFPSPDMLGETAIDRARTREFVSVIDDAAMQLGIWCRRASPLFAGREQQDHMAATFAADSYVARLRLLDTLARENDGPFLTGPKATIADCILLATVQFAAHVYGVPLPSRCRKLASWHAHMSSRPSASLPAYPEAICMLSKGLQDICPPADP